MASIMKRGNTYSVHDTTTKIMLASPARAATWTSSPAAASTTAAAIPASIGVHTPSTWAKTPRCAIT